MNNKNNQHKKILNYLETHGSITPLDAIYNLGITKLSTRIGEIEKKQGVEFFKRFENGINRDGQKTRYMRYFLGN